MSASADLVKGWHYVHRGLIWHVAEAYPADSFRPSSMALCGKEGPWLGDTQGAWPVGKLCGTCRRRLPKSALEP